MKQVAIIQSSYIPWKGYFETIHRADVFVFLDDVQYTTRDWRSRNRIKTRDGKSRWLSVPVLGGQDQKIYEARIDNSRPWAHKHLEALRHSYGKTAFFERYFPDLEEILARSPARLSELNQSLTRKIAQWLGIETEFVDSCDFGAPGAKDDKLLALIEAVGGDHHLSGPSARDYIVPEKFAAAGVGLEYMDYSHYPPYAQISEPFDHYVSVLDMLFMLGPDAPEWIWGAKARKEGF